MSNMMMMQAVTPEDIVEARLIIELGTVTLAAARATDDDIAALEAHCAMARAALEAKRYTREISWEFHTLLADAAHNGAFDGLTHLFRTTLSMHPVRQREGARAFAKAVDEHEEILTAVERRDGAAARVALAAHLLRGTGLEARESELLELWQAQPRQRSRSRRAR
jgi:DNA-binding FadR family transcriptional regulator